MLIDAPVYEPSEDEKKRKAAQENEELNQALRDKINNIKR